MQYSVWVGRRFFLGSVILTAWSGAVAAQLGGTNIWTGAGGDYLWSNDLNWKAVNCAGTEISPATFRDGATPCVFDFSALPSGSTVVDDISAKKLFPMGFVFKANVVGDSWTLVGNKDCLLVSRVGNVNHNCTCVVPEGCTVNYGLRFGNNYSTEGDVIVTGGGTLNMNSASYGAFKQKFVVRDSILRIDAALVGMTMCWIALEGDAAKFVLDKDQSILGLMSQGDETPTVELGAFTLTQSSGFPDSKSTYKGVVTGTGDFVLNAGVLSTMTASQTMTGSLALGNSDLTLTGAAALVASMRTRFDYSGRLQLANSQTLKTVVGEGVTGGVDVPQGATLTVTGENAETGSFNGRFSGKGAVTVDAAGYAYELDGSSHHEPPLRVKAGKVTLASAPATYAPTTDDSEVYLNFESGLTVDSSTNGYEVVKLPGDTGTVSLSQGRAGNGVEFDRRRLSVSASNVVGNPPQTVSVWFNVLSWPDEKTYLFRRNENWKDQFFLRFDTDSKISGGFNHDDVSGGGASYTSPTPLVGTGWHHLVYTIKPNVPHSNGNLYTQSRLYLDGNFVASYLYCGNILWQTAADKILLGFSNTKGMMDEFKYVGRLWSAEEVAAEYNRCRAYFANEVAALPAPVAHWAFDDAENPGKDTSGNGYDLSVPDKIVLYKNDGTTYDSGEVTAPVVDTIAGAYGKAAKFSGNYSKGRALKYTGSTFPAKIPTGNSPFTISVRFQDISQAGPTLVGWGDVTTSRGNIRATFGGSPSAIVCAATSNGSSHNGCEGIPGYGDFFSTPQFVTGGNLGEAGNWSHAVFVWEPATQMMKCYFDGRRYNDGVIAHNRSFTPMAASGKNELMLTPQDLIVGCNVKATSWGGQQERFFGGYIDDIQIFDCSLSEAQVERLVREMNPETREIGTAMTVDAGAELEVMGWTEKPLKSIANSGTLTVDGSTRLSVSSGTLGGTVNGCGAIKAEGGTVTFAPTAGTFTGVLSAKNGSLVVSAAAPSATVMLEDGGSVRGAALTADVTIPEGYVIMTDATKKNLPITATTGAVTVPAAAVWQFGATAEEIGALADHEFPLASGKLTLPADFSQWTCADEKLRIRYYTKAGANGTTELYAKVTEKRGLVILVR